MNGLRKRKKLSVFTFTRAAHTSPLILFTYVKPAKVTFVRTENLRDNGNPPTLTISTLINQGFFLSEVYREFGVKIMEIKVAEINAPLD